MEHWKASVRTAAMTKCHGSQREGKTFQQDVGIYGRGVEEEVLTLSSNDIFKRVMNSQARLELAPPKHEMKGHKLGPRPEAEQQLKTLGNLHTHSTAPSSASTEWLGLQNTSMSVPGDHRPLSGDTTFRL